MEVEITLQYNARGIFYETIQILHVVAGLNKKITFYTEDPYGVRDILNIFLLPKFYLSTDSEAELVAQRWDIELDRSTLKTHVETDVSFLQQYHSLVIITQAPF